MASAWGKSWGSAWRSAWGSVGVAVAGAAGGSGRKKRVYVERDGKILVFRNASDAAYYTTQKKAEEAPRKIFRKAPSKPFKPIPHEVIDLSMLEGYGPRLKAVFNDFKPVQQLFDDGQIGLLLELARKVREWQDEEDIEILLLYA